MGASSAMTVMLVAALGMVVVNVDAAEPAVTWVTGTDFRNQGAIFTKPLEADTVIAFISPKCPYCKRLEPTVYTS